MEKRSILALALAVTVLMFFQWYSAKMAPPPKKLAPETSATEAQRQAGYPEVPASATAPTSLFAPVTPAATSAPAVSEEMVNVETDLYRAVFSTRGGTVKEWYLKEYKELDGREISILKDGGVYPALGIGTGNDFSLSQVVFELTGEDLKLSESRPTGTLVFEYSDEGRSIRRTFTFYHDSYRFDIKDEVRGLPDYRVVIGAEFGRQVGFPEDRLTHTGPVVLSGSDREEFKLKDLKEMKSYSVGLKWIAYEGKYFFSALIPRTPVVAADAWSYLDTPLIGFRSTETTNEFTAYAGPKVQERLVKIGSDLEYVLDFGFFSIIARPIFWLMKKIYSVIGNYGWAIVLLTIIIRVPFIPLVNKSQKAMKRFQMLKPKMDEIKAKYKKDQQKMQKEMMGLYKKHKANPLGGCLPMLLQIPVFFALYKVLWVAIELRGAPFIFWITDLAQKDPYYVLPLAMGITMFLQQKLTPTGGDPKQQKMMMYMMPVVFTFLFLSFSSGLVLYWFVNNLLSVAQQLYVNAKLKKEEEEKERAKG